MEYSRCKGSSKELKTQDVKDQVKNWVLKM